MFSLTHWGPDNMVAILQTTFLNAFSSMKIVLFRLEFKWKKTHGSTKQNSSLVQIRAWRRAGDKPLFEPMMAYVIDAYMNNSA